MSKDKILLVVESPAKARKINKYLGKDYIVKASFGHIFDLVVGGKHGFGVDIEKGFKPKYKLSSDKEDKVRAILSAAKTCSKVYIASDPDREGEAIAWHIADVLKKLKIKVYRVTFNAITKAAVNKAVASPGDLNKDLYDAQQARRVLDRIVGFSVSPFIINKFGPKLSAGRVQSVALRLVVDREREIEAFKPEEYWNIIATLSKFKNGKDKFNAKYVNKVTNKKQALEIKADLDKDSYKVVSVEESEKKKRPPPPLITSSLAAIAAGRFRFSASKTMKLAQKLYETGMITYMRTDSYRIDPEAINACRNWIKNKGYDLPAKPNVFSKKGSAQDAHEAIRPTDVNNLPSNIYAGPDEKKIYKLIWETFIASQMNPAIYDSVVVLINSSSGHTLKATGRVLKYKGWLEVLEDFDDGEKDCKLPKLKANDVLFLVPPGVKAEQKFTQPPARFSEKTLIKELEKRGIGRPSTYATIMSKITDRNYAEKKSNAFVPTDLGKNVIDTLVKFFKFMEYNYTSDMETMLDQIADGKLKYVKMLGDFYPPFKAELKKAVLDDTEDYGFTCAKCNERMILRHGKFGFYLSCYNFPDCRYTKSCYVENGKPVLRKTNKLKVEDDVECPKCKSGMVKKDGKFGPFYSCSKYPKCTGTKKVPYGKKCPKCGSDLYATIFQGKSVLFCTGYPNCKHSEDLPKGSLPDPKSLCDKANTPSNMKKVLRK